MLIIICGLPGSGKTTLAKALCKALPALHVSSDLMRKRLFPKPAYSEAEKARVYSAMMLEAERALRAGKDVVADATFQRAARREEFLALAREMGVRAHVLMTVLNEEEIRRRLGRRRKGGPSDADFAVYQRMRADFEAPDGEYLVVDSMLPEQDKLRLALEFVGR